MGLYKRCQSEWRLIEKMIIAKEVYKNRRIQLLEDAPTETADVTVVSVESDENEKAVNIARRSFEGFTGSINRVIDEKVEQLIALDDKYR